MALIDIKQLRGASQGSVLFLGTNSIVSENYNNLRWDQTTNTLTVDGVFQYIDGNQQSGYVLVSDASGNATWTSSVVVGATNGLSEISSGVIGIGGTLSQNTTINSEGFDFTLQNFDTLTLTGSVVDIQLDNGLFLVDVDNGSIDLYGGDGTLVFNSGLDISSTDDFTLTTNTASITTTNLEGLVYTNDYTGTFVTNSLVTKGYVDSVASSIGANNGLSEITPGTVSLGGTLSQNTYINGDGYSFTLGNVDILHLTSSIFDVESSFVIIDAGTGSMQLIADDDVDIVSNGNQLTLGGYSGRVTTGNLEGFVYTTDYTSTFVTHSLITKGYVDDGTASIWNYITSMGANTSGTSGTSGSAGTSGTSGESGTSGTSGTGFNTISNFGNNRVLTSDGTTNAADAESNLTFDGTNLTVSGNVFITGSISVAGSSSIINTTNLTISDPIIALGLSQSGSPFLDEGLMFVRGTGATQAFIWDESEDRFALVQTNDDYNVIGNVNIDSYSNLRAGDLFIGEAQTPSLYTTKKVTLSSGTNSIYSFATSSYSGAFVDYTIESGSNARSGNLMSIWNGNSIQYVENSTIDIGNTTGVTFSFVISGSNAVLQAISDTSGWVVKTILRSI